MQESRQLIGRYAEAGVVILDLAKQGIAGTMQGSPHRPRRMVMIQHRVFDDAGAAAQGAFTLLRYNLLRADRSYG